MTNLLPISSTIIHAKLSKCLEGAEEQKHQELLCFVNKSFSPFIKEVLGSRFQSYPLLLIKFPHIWNASRHPALSRKQQRCTNKMRIVHNYSTTNIQLCFMFLPSPYLLQNKTGMGEAGKALDYFQKQNRLDYILMKCASSCKKTGSRWLYTGKMATPSGNNTI